MLREQQIHQIRWHFASKSGQPALAGTWLRYTLSTQRPLGLWADRAHCSQVPASSGSSCEP
eukprot:NODE_2632_length_1073_cov_16.869141_g2193_i0.p4 GENE.NODE_2632_length_1073_cov_16.869141_g2193_i0~~NODE_2632_length_1073_cov_16.869141_g2193_i0.p4  ORF type:complete len:61 (+),score=0.56 NODE_2632_length_1073_cov_16.869141_g2193_i0:416-598(+)